MKTFLRGLRGQVTRPKTGGGVFSDASGMTTSVGTILFSVREDNPLAVRVIVHTHRFGMQEFVMAREILAHPIKGEVSHDAPAHVFCLEHDVSMLFNADGQETLVVIDKNGWRKMMKKLDKRLPETLMDDVVDKFVKGLGL